MNIIELCQQIVNEKQAVQFRVKDGVIQQRDLFAKGKGWTILDMFSASTVLQIHAAVKDEMKAQLISIDPIRAVNACLTIAAKN